MMNRVRCTIHSSVVADFRPFFFRACVDTSGAGDLGSCKLLGEYSKTFEYAHLTSSDQLNYAVNVWDDGKILEIVSMCCKLYIFHSLVV